MVAVFGRVVRYLGSLKIAGKIAEYQQLKGLVRTYTDHFYDEPSASDPAVSWTLV